MGSDLFCWHGSRPSYPLKGRCHCKSIQNYFWLITYILRWNRSILRRVLFSRMKIIHIHRTQSLFDEYENYVNHMIWALQSPDFNTTENLFKVIKTLAEEKSFWRMMYISLQFHRLVESVPRSIDTLLTMAQHFINTLYVFFLPLNY